MRACGECAICAQSAHNVPPSASTLYAHCTKRRLLRYNKGDFDGAMAQYARGSPLSIPSAGTHGVAPPPANHGTGPLGVVVAATRDDRTLPCVAAVDATAQRSAGGRRPLADERRCGRTDRLRCGTRRYINTVGRIEPSYVIQKFLDAQRIHNLTK